ncbi:MAG TPA: hypothetical protein VMB47_11630 [Candidatus Aquilonibacter sp.]|nr:hypothetical protein [Candidatus Aquilonibacter sp.]
MKNNRQQQLNGAKQALCKFLSIAALSVAATASLNAQQFHEGRRASVLGRTTQYVRTHKELLLADTLVVAALSADAASSVHCQQTNPVGCIESNPFLGRHPSASATWGYSLGFSAGIVAINHALFSIAPKDPVRHIALFSSVAIAVTEIPTVRNNVQTSEARRAFLARQQR